MQDIFFEAKGSYTTGLNPVNEYAKQLSNYIQTTRGVSAERAKQVAVALIKKNLKDKPLKCFERAENGDRGVKDTTLLHYIRDNLKEGNVLTPTFTSYMPASKKKSILAEFIAVAVKTRGKAKKEAQRAKAVGDILLSDNKNNEQNNLKTYCNSMSGAFAQEACILHNPSNHSTLTSITRTMTSMCNANNERIISGNRYYPRGIDVLNNVIYICSNTDEKAVKKAIDTMGLHLPTVQETVEVLQRSSDLYFKDYNYYQTKIIPYLSRVSPYMLASICYSGDFYHLRKFNDSFVKTLLTRMTARWTGAVQNDPDIVEKLEKIDESILYYVHHVFYTGLKGRGKSYKDMLGTLIPESIYQCALRFIETLKDYKLFFNAFFMTSIMPCNSFRLKNMLRRAVVLSDTDSTCFTVDEWVTWYNDGEFVISPESVALGGAMCYVITQVIVNLLRVLSRNLNIDKDMIDKLGMKNEFLWLAHAPAEISKHYYAYTVIQEGTVLTVPEIEIKGVHLKNSATPKFVIDDAREMMKGILESVSSNKKIRLNDILTHVIGLEEQIRDSVFKGEHTFLKRSKIKTADAYALEATKSPYARHTFWNEIFAPKYGAFPEPPYDVIKIPTVLKNVTAVKSWLGSMEDVGLRASLAAWFTSKGKSNLPTLYLNDMYVTGSGIPAEILSCIDINRIILDITKQHRVILETLGVIIYKDRLISQQFKIT